MKAPAQKRHSRISIASATPGSIPECTPNLMPFHIAYTGPAPVSTYFCVADAKTHIGAPEPSLIEGSISGSTDETDNSDVAQHPPSEENDASSSSLNTTKQHAVDSGTLPLPSNSITNTQPRFVSAFRGRTVHGLKVELPEGHTGVVLRSGDEVGRTTKGSGKSNSKGKGKANMSSQQEERRSTRRSARSRIADEEIEMDIDDDAEDENKGPESTLNLAPSSQFKSFVLWHPDIPVDTGKDEYMSSINEWIRIASVVRLQVLVAFFFSLHCVFSFINHLLE